MRGRVLSYDDDSAAGLISGDDGQRYGFTRGDLQNGARVIAAGAVVHFETSDGKAASIYSLASAMAGQVGDKNKIAAALLALFLGGIGIHKFYLGKMNAGIIMLLCGTLGWILIIPPFVVWIISLVEFVIYLTKPDQDFYQDYVVGDKSWF